VYGAVMFEIRNVNMKNLKKSISFKVYDFIFSNNYVEIFKFIRVSLYVFSNILNLFKINALFHTLIIYENFFENFLFENNTWLM
jgi:hypothetical protein